MVLITPKNTFGWRGVFRTFGLRALIFDSVSPIIIAVIIVQLSIFWDYSIIELIELVIGKGLVLMTVIFAFVLTSFAIGMSMIYSGKLLHLTEYEKGRYLIRNINAKFLVTIFFCLVTTILMFIVSVIKDFKITTNYAHEINCIVIFLILYGIFLSFIQVYYALGSLYNLSQSILFEKKKEPKV